LLPDLFQYNVFFFTLSVGFFLPAASEEGAWASEDNARAAAMAQAMPRLNVPVVF
jgi:hypothetical protein